MSIKKFVLSFFAGSFFFCGACNAQLPDESIIRIRKDNAVILPYLLSVNRDGKPHIGAILFTGGEGVVGLLTQGIPAPGANFLVRSRSYLTDRHIATAVFDPSSESGMLLDSRRMSDLHADEVQRVVLDFKARTGVEKIYLVGTSRGTVSAAYVGKKLAGLIDGVVLTSTIFLSNRVGNGLSGFDFDEIGSPMLIVNHVLDTCKVTSLQAAIALGKKYPLVLVEGIDGQQSDPCGPFSAHGYLGREHQTMDAIADWIIDRRVAPSIK